jgi:uncharacterized glyoxalase superfamily protein PhnB
MGEGPADTRATVIPALRYRDAVAAGAEIVEKLADADYGGRGYSCRDPEGHVWSFGTYDPWAG